jgi:dCMP deaminase
MSRPDRHEWHLRGVKWLAEMGDCTRRKVGALIVGPDKRIWGMGYNGTYSGGPSCLAGDCPRGRHYKTDTPARRNYALCQGVMVYDSVDICGCGNVWPCPDAVDPGSSYDTGPGTCIATHAEMNAKNDALRRSGGDLDGCQLYVSEEPCEGCIRELRNSTKIGLIHWSTGTVALP